jgi:GTPase SAR1 family protein
MNSRAKYSIVLIGETGTGKSSFGNYLLGRNEFKVSAKENSCTTQTISKTSSRNNLIEIIDTPGFSDSEGRDKELTQKMIQQLKSLKENKKSDLRLILLILNFRNPRIDAPIQNMIRFYCNVFPKNLAYHFGIVFTNYHHEYEIQDSDSDPREMKQKNYMPKVMKIISDETEEPLNLKVPVYFVDNKRKDKDSEDEINNIFYFVTSLSPIEEIRECDSKFKNVEDIFRTNSYEKIEDDGRIVIINEVYRKQKFTDFMGNEFYGSEELYSRKKEYKEKALPKLEEKKIGEYIVDFFDHVDTSFKAMKLIRQEYGDNFAKLPCYERVLVLFGANAQIINEKKNKKK